MPGRALPAAALMPLLAAAATAVDPPPRPSPQHRLIRRNATVAASWASAEEVTALLRRRHADQRDAAARAREGRPPSECGVAAGPGFIDVTHVAADGGNRTAPRRQWPSGPQHRHAVAPVIERLERERGRLRSFLAPLTELHNRYYTGPWALRSSEQIRDHAARAIAAHRRRRDASVRLEHNPDFPQPNIVARIEAAGAPAARRSEVLILGAHMDSINSDGPESEWERARAPGADDDGSGSSAVMHVFETLLELGFAPSRPIEFHWYAGEERGLLGSRVLADRYRRQGVEVWAMLQIDMAAGPPAPMKFILDYVDVGLSRFEQSLVDEYCQLGHVDGECGYACSDHASWHDEGYPASFPIESEGTRDPDTGLPCPGHTADDRLECVNFDTVLDYARLGAAFVVELNFHT